METLNLTIRRAQARDIDAILNIEKNCFASPWSRDSILSDLENNPCARYLACELDNSLIAYAGIWIILDEGHITNIAVLPEFRGLGIGKILFQRLLEYASNLGVNYSTLEVRQSNTIAQALYKGFGFFHVHTRKKYYEDNGEDAYLMVCDSLPKADQNFSEIGYLKSIKIDRKAL